MQTERPFSVAPAHGLAVPEMAVIGDDASDLPRERPTVEPVRRTRPAPRPTSRAGDIHASAVAEAFEAHRVELYLFAVHSTRDVEAAHDIVQEAYLRLVREVRRAGLPDNPRAWLYRVVANLTVSRVRRAASALRWLHRHRDTTVDVSPEDTALRRELHADLGAALGRLPRDARIGLLLAASGFSGREVAVAIGRSETATRSLLSRARLRLREELRQDEGD